MLSHQKKMVISLSAGLLLLGQGLVRAEESSSSTVPSSTRLVSSSSSSVASSSSPIETVASSLTEQELSSSLSQVQGSSSQEETPASSTATELTPASSSQVPQPSTPPSSVAPSNKKETGVQLDKVLAKDYHSLEGTWKNGQGTVLFVTREGLIYTKGANGGFLSLDGLDKTKSALGSAISLKSQPDQQKTGHLYLVPAGKVFVNPTVNDFKDKTKQDKDRFSLGEAYEMGKEDQVFYRVSTKLEWAADQSSQLEETPASSSAASSQTETEATPPASESAPSSQETAVSSSSETSTSSSQQANPVLASSSSTAPSTSSSTPSSAPSPASQSGAGETVVAEQGPGLDTLPRTRTVTRRILPSTGDRMGLLLPILGAMSCFIAAVLIKKGRKK